MHWALDYLGKEWVSGGQGPDAFDCWGLVRYVQKKHYDREIAEINVDADDIRAVVKAFSHHEERASWDKVDNPEDSDCLLLSQSYEPTHVGIWLDIDGGGLLHCVKNCGVVFSNFSNIKTMGYNVLGVYRCSRQ